MSTEAAATLFNFAPGPAQLPPEVLAQAADAVHGYPPHGRSILELSHRSPTFDTIAQQAEEDLRQLLQLPDDYAVLFLNGGARVHYALWLDNLTTSESRLSFVLGGFWSELAYAEARRHREHIQAVQAASSTDFQELAADTLADFEYVHYVSNETLTGFRMPAPQAPGRLVCDRTSDFLSEPFDIRDYAMCYAGTQKNLGCAGLTVVVARRDCLLKSTSLPPGLSYAAQLQAGCRVHTPSIFSWYVCALMLRWIVMEGGLKAMQQRAQARAEQLYQCIDASSLYVNEIAPRARSHMNICFNLAQPELESRFLEEAEAAGLLGLRGHSSVGGLRASLYNAMPEAGAAALAEFMQNFERRA